LFEIGEAGISTYREARDPQGRNIVEIGMNPPLAWIQVIVVPFCLFVFAYMVMGRGRTGIPWGFMVWLVVVSVLGFAIVSRGIKGTKVRVTIDSGAGKLLVATSTGQSEIRIADVSRAEFVLSDDSAADGLHHLEFVMKNGGRVPATTMSTIIARHHQAKMIAAINTALAPRD
jgi:hypothetical protein